MRELTEKIVIDYLVEKNIKAAGEESPGDDQYVIVEQVGGGMTNGVIDVDIAIRSVAASRAAAAQLNEKVKSYMDDINTLPEINRATRQNDYNNTDINKRKYQYQAIYNIVRSGGIRQ